MLLLSIKEHMNTDKDLVLAFKRGQRYFLEFCYRDDVDKDDAARYLIHVKPRKQWSQEEHDEWFRKFAPRHIADSIGGSGIGPEVDLEDLGEIGVSWKDIKQTIDRGLSVKQALRGAKGLISKDVKLPQIVHDRRQLCLDCEHAKPDPENDQKKKWCGECGCLLRPKTRKRKERCPIGKW